MLTAKARLLPLITLAVALAVTLAPAAEPRTEVEPNENNAEAMAVQAGDTVGGMVHFGDNKDTYKLSFPQTGKAIITLSGFPNDAAFQVGSAGFQKWDTSPASWTDGERGESFTHTFDVIAGKPGYIWVTLTSRASAVSAGLWGGMRCSADGPWYTTPPKTGKAPPAPATHDGVPVRGPITYTLALGARDAPGEAAGSGSEKAFRVPGIPLTFSYPSGWSDVISADDGHEITHGSDVSVRLCRVAKSEQPKSSAWSQIILAQDQLVQQGGTVVRLNARPVAGQEAPYALVAFAIPMPDGTQLGVNVAQFIIEHGDAYYWLSFKGPAAAWERDAPQFKRLLTTLRLGDS